MSYEEFCKLDGKIDRVIEKLDSLCQRISIVETKQNIYSSIIKWGGTTVVSAILAISLKVFF